MILHVDLSGVWIFRFGGILKVFMRTGAFLLFTVLHSQWVFADEETTLMIAPEVADAIGVLDDSSPAKHMVSFGYKLPLAALKNLAIPNEGNSQYLGQNKWGTQSTALINGNKTQTATMSLCGLVDLVTSSETKLATDTTTMVPIGRIFMPLGLKVNRHLDISSKANKLVLSVDARKICNPPPGTSFSYDLSTEFAYGSSTSFGSNSPFLNTTRKIVVSFAWTCSVAVATKSEAFPASLSYLPVECKGVNQSTQKEVVSLLAYLPEAALYIPLGRQSDPGKGLFEYTRLELEDRAPQIKLD